MSARGPHTRGRAYAEAVGANLRAARSRAGLTLAGVEEGSLGVFAAPTLAAYERGDRMVTIVRLAEFADFYGVPVGDLLPEAGRASRTPARGRPLVIDLVRLAFTPREHSGLARLWVARICDLRGDRNGEVLTVRASDIRSLAALHDLTPEQMRERMLAWGALATGARLAELTAPRPRPYGRSGYRLRGVG